MFEQSSNIRLEQTKEEVDLKNQPSYFFITNRKDQLYIHYVLEEAIWMATIQFARKRQTVRNMFGNWRYFSFPFKCRMFSIQRRLLFLNIDAVYNNYNISSKYRIFNVLILGDNPPIPKNASLEILQHIVNFVRTTKRLN